MKPKRGKRAKMDKTEFLEICQRVAVLPKREYGIKSVPLDLCVKCEGVTFYPIGYKLTFDEGGKPLHSAILHDLKANSFLECDLSKVERMGEG